MEEKKDCAKRYSLRERISELGFKQIDIANALGIERVNFSKMLIGNPTLLKLTQIADYMNIPLYRLLMTKEEEEALGVAKEEKVISTFVSSETGKKYKIVEIDE